MRRSFLAIALACLCARCIADEKMLVQERFDALPKRSAGELVDKRGVDNTSHILSAPEAYRVVGYTFEDVPLGKTLSISFSARSDTGATAHVYLTVKAPGGKTWYHAQAFPSKIREPRSDWQRFTFTMPLTREAMDLYGKTIVKRYEVRLKKQGDAIQKNRYEQYWVGRDTYDGPDKVQLEIGIFNLTNSKYAKPGMKFDNSRLALDDLTIELVAPDADAPE